MPTARRFSLAASILLSLIFILSLMSWMGAQAHPSYTPPPPAFVFGPPADPAAQDPGMSLMVAPALPVMDALHTVIDAAPRPLPEAASSASSAPVSSAPNLIYTVTNTNDSGPGSLRDAVAQANANLGHDEIQFNLSGCPCLITFGSEIATSGELTITGPGSNLLTLSGANTTRLFNSTAASSPLHLSGLTLTQGHHASAGGGAILAGDLSLTNVIVQNSSATIGGGVATNGSLMLIGASFQNNTASTIGGGGVYVAGNLTATNSIFGYNIAYADGGGAYVAGNATFTLGQFNNNRTTQVKAYGGGGGLVAFGVTTVNGTQFISNQTPAWGGGAYLANFPVGTTNRLLGAGFTSNQADYGGGGLFQWYNAAITDTQFINNQSGTLGGGLYAGYAGSYTIRLSRGVIQGNTAPAGGGLYSDSSITLDGVSVSTNTASNGQGGGALTVQRAFVSNSVFSQNTIVTGGNGGGLAAQVGAAITDTQFLSNTIQSNHSGGGLLVGISQGNGNASLLRVTFTGNSTASGFGGGMYSFGTTRVVDSTFDGNTSRNDGGGAWVGGPLTVQGSLFIHNKTLFSDGSGGGGGLISHHRAVIDNTQFISNTTADWGGGAYIYNPYSKTASVFTGVDFTDNKAQNGGGGGLFSWYTTTLSAPSFSDNYAGYRGGGLYAGYAGNYKQSVTSGIFQRNSARGGGGLFSDSEFTLVDTDFLANISRSNNGGGAWTPSNARVTGSTFVDNIVQSGGNSGGLDTGNSAWITDTLFLRNRTLTGSGGGSGSGGNATILRGTYIENTAFDDGGGMLAYGTATVKQSQFDHNTTSDLGGGLAVTNLTAQSITMTHNHAGSAGGIFINVSFDISTSTVEDNQAQFSGGGLSTGTANPGKITLTSFVRNQAGATGSGGGIYSNSTPLEITGCSFDGNTAGNLGGGVHAAQVTLSGTGFTGNSAGSRGGGLSLWGGSSQVKRSSFTGNHAVAGGGLTVESSASGSLENSLLAGNTALGGSGDAAYFDTSASFEIRHATIASPTQASGSALYLNTGTLLVQNTVLANHQFGLVRTGGSATLNHPLFFANNINTQGTSITINGAVVGDPAFLDPASGDYHISVGSLAVNAGLNLGTPVDYDGDFRPQGSAADIGFDEAVTPSGLIITHDAPKVFLHLVSFSGSTAFGQGVLYTWNFGDGSSAQGKSVSHAYASPGNYTVTLTAANAAGQNVTTTQVTITANSLYLPIIIR